MARQVALELPWRVSPHTQGARLNGIDNPFALVNYAVDYTLFLGSGKDVGVSLTQVLSQQRFSGESLLARVAEPFPAVKLYFVVVPIVTAAEEAIGFETPLKRTHVRPKIPEYMFPMTREFSTLLGGEVPH